MYAMTEDDFEYWLGIFKEHFPEDARLARAHGEWRPGSGTE
jgi:hypothetical protein